MKRGTKINRQAEARTMTRQAPKVRSPIITFEQAIAQHMFGYELRAIATSLERRAKYPDEHSAAFDWENRDNAYHLRKLAKVVDVYWENHPIEFELVVNSRIKESDDLWSRNEDKGIHTENGHFVGGLSLSGCLSRVGVAYIGTELEDMITSEFGEG